MKKLLIIILIAINSYILVAQQPYIIEGTVINNTETGAWNGVSIPRNLPIKLIYRNNSITSRNNSGYLLQSGDENPSERDHNLDNQEIIGNILEWQGTDDPEIITHGILTGYNINSIVKYNKLIDVPYGIIFKSGTDTGENMTFTNGGCAYNICTNGKFAVRMKGINGVKVYNNTFYTENIYSKYLLLITSNQDRIIPAASMGSRVFNNIFYTKVKVPMISIESKSLEDFESDYNIFWYTEGEPIFAVNGEIYSWAQWNALGFDIHSKIINPKFNNTTDFIPEEKLDFGFNLGVEWEEALSTKAKWIPGEFPATTIQSQNWQIGAIINEAIKLPVSNDTVGFNILPNPSNGNFRLKINNLTKEGAVVEIKNVHGQKLIERKITENDTDWSVNQHFGNIFFITVLSKNFHSTKRIIINK